MTSFTNAHTIHIIGIKGAGVSALACILKKQGKEVCGSDIEETFFTDELLRANGIACEAFSTDHIRNDHIDLIIFSTAWKDSLELSVAREKGIPVLSYPEALGQLFNSSYGIAVAGSHGKTTTTGMLAHVLKQAGYDPTALVGSALTQYGANAFAGSSQYFVIEADEYENKFQQYEPRALLLTNIDYDHPDYFKTPESYTHVFQEFVTKILNSSGAVIACGDDDGVRALPVPPEKEVYYYGVNPSFPYAVSLLEQAGTETRYVLFKKGTRIGTFSIHLPGIHNVLNALGVIAICDVLELVEPARSAALLGDFRGTARRFEYKGNHGALRIYDDFAHHPSEVQATLSAAQQVFGGDARIWCVFSAHTFSRTKILLSAFGHSFGSVTKVLILDIYGSAREQAGTIHGTDLADVINASSANARYVGTHEEALREILAHIDEIDVLITMGAGDAWQIGERLLSLPNS